MSKQTAVEWLIEQVNHKGVVYNNYHIITDIPKEIIEQAKAMEKKHNEENMAHAITFGWELSHYHRDKEPEKLLQMQKDFIITVIKGGYK
jgi:hypothetical protein